MQINRRAGDRCDGPRLILIERKRTSICGRMRKRSGGTGEWMNYGGGRGGVRTGDGKRLELRVHREPEKGGRRGETRGRERDTTRHSSLLFPPRGGCNAWHARPLARVRRMRREGRHKKSQRKVEGKGRPRRFSAIFATFQWNLFV